MAEPPTQQQAPPSASPAGSGSRDDLVAVSSRAAFYKKKSEGGFGTQLATYAAILLLLLVVLALAVALGIIAYRYAHSQKDVCSSSECVRAADNLIQSMEPNADPCGDFYRYACGRWPERHPLPDSAISHDWFADRSERMARSVRSFLKENNSRSDPLPVRQARQLYRACTDVRRLDALGLAPMQAVLRAVGLPLPVPVPTAAAGFSLVDVLAQARLLVGRDLLVGVGVYPDARDRAANRLTVSPPDPSSPLPAASELDRRVEGVRLRSLAAAALADGGGPRGRGRGRARGRERRQAGDSPLLASYLRYMARVMRLAYTWNSTRGAGLDLEAAFLPAARKVQALEAQLYRLMHPAGGQPPLDPQEMFVWELQRFTDRAANATSQLDWRALFRRLFRRVRSVSLELDGRDRIVLLNSGYLASLASVLAAVDRVVLQNYLWWVLVETLAPHLDREMRALKVRYLEEVTDSHTQPARSIFCAGAVNHMLGMAVSVPLASPGFRDNTGAKVAQMLADVRDAFEERVAELDWMDGATKAATREKAAAMTSFIGFPDWLLRSGSLEEYYEGLQLEEGAYLNSLLAVSQLLVSTMLESLRTVNEEPGWVTDPTDVNAFHTFQANAITVPSGILQFPFYDLGVEYLNYGAIGSILGHELTHGFDDQGRQFDKSGNMRQWWSNATVREYENRTQCFVDQYEQYRLEEIGANVDGRLTLGENIADNGGLREALRAYRRFQARRGSDPEPRLPGLEHLSWEKLFFLAFANVWCEAWTAQSLRYDVTNEHSPNHVRVRGVLANMKEFAHAWGCERGSGMNPHGDKCVIW